MKTPVQLLWERWGDPEYPAEWDGRHGNGGKGSQRFWEYLWVLNELGTMESVLDVGAGKDLFLAKLLRDTGHDVTAVDPQLDVNPITLEEFVSKPPHIHFSIVTCISVLEHISDKPAFCRALDTFKRPIVMTLEFGPGGIENRVLTQCLAEFKNHHVDHMEACPVWAENSDPLRWRPLGITLAPNQ
jgi:hypothetical protein